jgi:Protein of unknown function (DUF3102)
MEIVMVDTRSTTVTTELDLLASRIKSAHKSITEHTRNVIDRAIEAGDALNQAKAKFDHGQWLAWLKNNCDLSERNAQIYMQLANNKSKLKSAEAADLSTLANVLRFIQGGGGQGDSGGGNASDLYDKAQKTLIKKLQALSVEQAEGAAKETIKELNSTVATMKAGAKGAKAA